MSTVVLLLSGGRSARMARNKAQLPIHGQTLLSWQQSRFEQAGFQVVSELVDRYDDFRGPLAGIDAAFQQYPNCESWLVVPVDMPLISVDAMKQLMAVGQLQARPVAYLDHPLPLYLPGGREVAQLLTRWLDDDGAPRSVFALISALKGQWLEPEGDPQQMINVNTPLEWQTFLAGEIAL